MVKVATARKSGLTLAEMLVVLAVLGVIAAVALPSFSNKNAQKLQAAASEVTQLLRLAVAESRRNPGSDRYILIDGKTTPGTLKLYVSNSSAQINTSNALTDPLTKRAAILDPNQNTLLQGITLTAQFKANSGIWRQLLIGPEPSPFTVFDGNTNKGSLVAGSGIVLSLGGQSVTVPFNETTGLVNTP
jgi:prepilin-type N-terminal cleavage/methylation domain-containing protein